MNYSKQIGNTLAEIIEELVICEETGLQLNEIRDLNSLQTAMSSYGRRHPHYQRLKALHAKKTAIVARQQSRQAKQHAIAQKFGYKARKNGTFVHRKTGHTLTINGNNSWSHQKSGVKRTTGSHRGLSALRGLHQHLAKLHPDV